MILEIIFFVFGMESTIDHLPFLGVPCGIPKILGFMLFLSKRHVRFGASPI